MLKYSRNTLNRLLADRTERVARRRISLHNVLVQDLTQHRRGDCGVADTRLAEDFNIDQRLGKAHADAADRNELGIDVETAQLGARLLDKRTSPRGQSAGGAADIDNRAAAGVQLSPALLCLRDRLIEERHQRRFHAHASDLTSLTGSSALSINVFREVAFTRPLTVPLTTTTGASAQAPKQETASSVNLPSAVVPPGATLRSCCRSVISLPLPRT